MLNSTNLEEAIEIKCLILHGLDLTLYLFRRLRMIVCLLFGFLRLVVGGLLICFMIFTVCYLAVGSLLFLIGIMSFMLLIVVVGLVRVRLVSCWGLRRGFHGSFLIGGLGRN